MSAMTDFHFVIRRRHFISFHAFRGFRYFRTLISLPDLRHAADFIADADTPPFASIELLHHYCRYAAAA